MSDFGISTAVQYPKALPLLKAYERFGHRAEQFPHAAHLANRCLSLPMYPELTHRAVEVVCDQLRRAALH
jgi:dTDP-4-amino-4,6-dideoxygalactose transaminase